MIQLAGVLIVICALVALFEKPEPTEKPTLTEVDKVPDGEDHKG